MQLISHHNFHRVNFYNWTDYNYNCTEPNYYKDVNDLDNFYDANFYNFIAHRSNHLYLNGLNNYLIYYRLLNDYNEYSHLNVHIHYLQP